MVLDESRLASSGPLEEVTGRFLWVECLCLSDCSGHSYHLGQAQNLPQVMSFKNRFSVLEPPDFSDLVSHCYNII